MRFEFEDYIFLVNVARVLFYTGVVVAGIALLLWVV